MTLAKALSIYFAILEILCIQRSIGLQFGEIDKLTKGYKSAKTNPTELTNLRGGSLSFLLIQCNIHNSNVTYPSDRIFLYASGMHTYMQGRPSIYAPSLISSPKLLAEKEIRH